MEARMEEIRGKVARNERLSREDGIFLYESSDIISLGEMARSQKERVSSRQVFFNANHHINLTNVCVNACRFCAFGIDEDAPGAYLMSVDDALEWAAKAEDSGITEFHVVSACHPEMGFEYYEEVISRLHERWQEVHIQAFTAVEIAHFAKISGLSLKEVLLRLQKAGLGSIPGGGAEILKDSIRTQVCPKKALTDEWLEVHSIAHDLGINTNCTMLYGHIESHADRIDHFIALRELQDRHPGFQAFVALPFLPDNTGLAHIERTSAVDDIKTIAISRLMLDNIPHIKAFWVMMGVDVAQLALHFGADDFDGTVFEEKIMHAAGANSKKGLSREEILRIIKDAGFQAVERDTIYNIIREY